MSDDIKLPELPETNYNACGDGSEPLYDHDQMHAYATEYGEAIKQSLAQQAQEHAGRAITNTHVVRKALKELVSLKDYKDIHGKDPSYINRMPRAWKAATSALRQSLDQSEQDVILQNWLTIIHDNDLSIGDRLQRLSSQINLILEGKLAGKQPIHQPRIREQDFAQEEMFSAMEDAYEEGLSWLSIKEAGKAAETLAISQSTPQPAPAQSVLVAVPDLPDSLLEAIVNHGAAYKHKIVDPSRCVQSIRKLREEIQSFAVEYGGSIEQALIEKFGRKRK